MPSLPLFVSSGDSLIARNDDLVVFAQGNEAHLRRLTTELAELVPSTDWTGLLRFLASKISTIGFDNHPPLACLRLLDDAVEIFVFGDLSISVETSQSTETVTGAGMTTWREATLPGHVVSASGGNVDFTSGIVSVLGRGLVAGGGFSLSNDNPLKSAGSMLSAISGATTVAATTPVAVTTPEPVTTPAAESTPTDPVAEFNSAFDEDDDSLTNESTPGADVSAEGSPSEEDVATPPKLATAEQFAQTETFSVPMIDGVTDEQHPGALETEPVVDHPTAGHPASGHPSADHPSAVDDDETFDPDLTTAFTGASLSEAVRDARSADPDPRRSSGVGEETIETPLAPTDLRGVHCPNGHLSSMQHPVCRTCSEPVDTNGPIVSGPRPILGVIEFDDGVRIPLDRPVVIGRQPPEDYRINGELAYVVPITDTESLISRIHVEVHLVGWDIELIDKNSVNGTFTSTTPESTSRSRLRSEHPTSIEIGTIIYVGDRVFRLNTGHIV